MSRHFIRDFSEVRSCPLDMLRRLRDVEPLADVLHLPNGKWVYGRYEPSWDRRRAAINRLGRLLQIPERKRKASWRTQYWMAQAQRQGFKPVTLLDYEPSGWLVNAVTYAKWYDEVTSALEFERQMDEAMQRPAKEAEKDLTDPGRAREAHRYIFGRSHAPGVSLTPTVPVPSGRTRHPISAA